MCTTIRIDNAYKVVKKLEKIRLLEKQIDWKELDIKEAGEDALFPNVIKMLKKRVMKEKALKAVLEISINELKKKI